MPLPWSGTSPSYGFGPGPASWLPQPDTWAWAGVQHQDGDPDSMLTLYRAALQHRRELPALGAGELTWLPSGENVLAFAREPGFVCVVNVGDDPAPVPSELHDAVPVLTNGPAAAPGILPAATAAWYLTG